MICHDSGIVTGRGTRFVLRPMVTIQKLLPKLWTLALEMTRWVRWEW